jgi:lipopolysaccharide export system protein LptA
MRLFNRAAFIIILAGVANALPMAPGARAQEQAEDDSVHVVGRTMDTRRVDGVDVGVLLEAILSQDSTVVSADQLIVEKENQYHLSGHVVISERGDTVRADIVRYDGNNKIGRASGNVILSDGASTLRSVSATYYSNEKRAEFLEGVEYSDSTTLLVSDRGAYRSEESIADFFGNVRLRQKDLYLEADSIHYERDPDLMQAFRRVVVDRFEGDVDSTYADRTRWRDFTGTLTGFAAEADRSLLYSDRVFYDGAIDSSWVEGDVLLLRTERREASIDSLLVTADAMVLTRTDVRDRVVASGSVVIAESEFAAIADSLRYDRTSPDGTDRAETHLIGRPRAWVNDSQITSDTLKVFGTQGSVDSLRAIDNLFVASEDTTIGRIQQLKGRAMTAYFENDSLRTMRVGPNAEALYYIEPNEGEPIVAVVASGDRIDFAFRGGEAEHVQVRSDIQGTLYPNEIIDQARTLEGYVWEPDRRPNLQALKADQALREQKRAPRGLQVPVSGEAGPPDSIR